VGEKSINVDKQNVSPQHIHKNNNTATLSNNNKKHNQINNNIYYTYKKKTSRFYHNHCWSYHSDVHDFV